MENTYYSHKKVKLFIVDDHQLVIDAISSYLLGNDQYELIGSASSPAQLCQMLKHHHPDILILDIKLPGINGTELALSIKEKYPFIKIVFLSSDTEKETIDKAIRSGGVGYLSKDISEEEFFLALDKIKNGQTYYSSGVQQVVFDGFTNAVKNSGNSIPLSDREIEIVKYFAEGYSYKEIAEKLFISVRTVEAHKRNILEKLGFKNTVELVKFAIKNGIVTL